MSTLFALLSITSAIGIFTTILCIKLTRESLYDIRLRRALYDALNNVRTMSRDGINHSDSLTNLCPEQSMKAAYRYLYMIEHFTIETLKKVG